MMVRSCLNFICVAFDIFPLVLYYKFTVMAKN
jgi:hypothetical protein